MFNKGKQKAKEAAALAKQKASEVDEKYSVVDSAKGASKAAGEKAKQASALAAAKAGEVGSMAGELGSMAQGMISGATVGPSNGTVLVAAPPGPERDALVRMFRDVPGGHYDVVDCSSMEEAKEELQTRGPGTGGRLRAIIVRGDLPARPKVHVVAGGGGVALNFDAPQQEPLPLGWEIRDSTQYFMEDGVTPRKFFIHTATNETSWERPKPAATAAGGDGGDDGSCVGLLEWFRMQMIGQAEEIVCVMALPPANTPQLKQQAGLKVARVHGFASFDQLNLDMSTKNEEDKAALVAELNATLQADLGAVKAVREAQAAKAKQGGAATVWVSPTPKEAVDQLARTLNLIEQKRQQVARRAYGPTVDLKVWTCTFNIACAKTPFEFGTGGNVEAVLSPFIPKDHDVYVIGMQEGMGDNFYIGVGEYLNEIGVELVPGQGRGYGPRIEGRGDGSLVSTKYTGIAAFAKTSLILDGLVKIERATCHAFKGEDMTKAKDLKESLGSKGGAALTIRCFDTTMACISVHMAKEWHKVAKKRTQYRELADQLGRKLGHPEYQLHSQFHHVVWMGDFNYHIAQEHINPDSCMKAIADIQSSWEQLGEHDEMRKEIEGKHAYYGFDEPEKALDFHPSYKKKVPREKSDYKTGETWVAECYDINFKQQWYKGGKVKLRMPSWTDRVLYQSMSCPGESSSASTLVPLTDQDFMSMGQPLYKAENDVLLCSDHSPVHASFQLTAINQRLEPKEQRRFRYKVEILDVTITHPGGVPPAADPAPVPEPALEGEEEGGGAEGGGGGGGDLLAMPAAPVAPIDPVDEREEVPDKVMALVPAPWEGMPDRKPECKVVPPEPEPEPAPAQPDLMMGGGAAAAQVGGMNLLGMAPMVAAAPAGGGDLLGLTPAAPAVDLLGMPAAPAPAPAPVDLLGMAPAPAPAAAAAPAPADGTDLLGMVPAAPSEPVGDAPLAVDDARNNIYRFVGGDTGSAATEHHICLKVMRKRTNPLTGQIDGYEQAEIALALKLPVAPPPAADGVVDLLGGATVAVPAPIRETVTGLLMADGMPWFGGRGAGPTTVKVVIETSLEPVGEGM